MKANQANIKRNLSVLILCSLFIGWLFSLPLPELEHSRHYFSYQTELSLEKAEDRQLKSNDYGITPTAARFNAVPELSTSSQGAKLIFFFNFKNGIYYHARLFYSSLRFINSCVFLFSSDFPILFHKLRI